MGYLKSSKPHEYLGKWFVPNLNTKIEGKLIIDFNKNNQILKLYTSIDFNKRPIKNNMNSHFEDYTIIWGDCSFNEKITLFNCRWKQNSMVGGDLFEVLYESTYSFIGGLLKNQDNTIISQLAFKCPYLSSWFDTNRDFFGSQIQANSLADRMKPTLTKDQLHTNIKINDEITLTIERQYVQDAWAMKKDIHAEIMHYVIVNSTTPKSFKDMETVAYRFMQLIQLSIARHMYVEFVSAIVNEDELLESSKHRKNENGNIFLTISNFSSLQKRNSLKSDYIHQGNMLFYDGNNNFLELKEIITNWFNSYEKYNSVINIFLDTIEWFQNTDAFLTHVMFNNRFLNLIQALENYHKITYSDMKDENSDDISSKVEGILKNVSDQGDQEWIKERICPKYITLKSRLTDLLENKLLIISSLLFKNKGKRRGFVEKIKNLRNDLSHGRTVDIDNEKMSDHYYKTQILLISCILLNLGFSCDRIKKELLRTAKYSNMIGFIQSRMNEK